MIDIKEVFELNSYKKMYAKFVIKAVYILIALLVWTVFLVEFIKNNSFSSWCFWGFASAILMLPTSIMYIINGTKGGYKDGQSSYVGTIESNFWGGIGVSFHDQRFLYAFIYFLVSIALLVVIGPVMLIIRLISQIVEVVNLIKLLLCDKDSFLKSLKYTGIIFGVLIVGLVIYLLVTSCK